MAARPKTEELFPTAPEIGAVIGGRYRLTSPISEGGVGVVWEAADPKERFVALKFLKWAPGKNKKLAAERFKNEFSILKSLSHPNIGQIYDFGLDGATGLYFFTSELFCEGDLRKVIDAPVAVVENLLLQSLRALEYLRSHNLLHLDIKPQNVLLRKVGKNLNAALIDFGLASFRSPDKPGGTPNYMPPEVVVRMMGNACHPEGARRPKDPMKLGSGDPSASRPRDDIHLPSCPPPDHRSDLYSLGVTFYYCLTGVQPFCKRLPGGQIDVQATLANHLNLTPPLPSAIRSQIPPYLDRIIMKLMARDIEDRYPSAIVAAQALQYSSPIPHAAESEETLLSYLPKEGRMIGRQHEREIIEKCLAMAVACNSRASGNYMRSLDPCFRRDDTRVTHIICIAGGRGVGKTRLLMAAKPYAQRLEMDVVEAGEAPLKGNNPQLVLIDNVDNSSSFSLLNIVKRIKLQGRLKKAVGPSVSLIFTVNTDHLTSVMADLGLDESICTTISLKNFTKEEVAEYLTALLGEEPDGVVVDQLMESTDGNPLFITENLEEMIRKGRLFSLAGRPDAKTLKAIGVDFSKASPKSFAEVVRQKVAHLPDGARELAQFMACWRRPVSAEELKNAFLPFPLPLEGEGALRAGEGGSVTTRSSSPSRDLLLLVASGLIKREEASGRFEFSNIHTAKVIRDLTEPKILARYHDAILACHSETRSTGRRIPRTQLNAGDSSVVSLPQNDTRAVDLYLAYGSDINKRIPALQVLAEQSMHDNDPITAIEHLKVLLIIIPSPLVGEGKGEGVCRNLTLRSDALLKLGLAYEKARLFDDAHKTYLKLKKIDNLMGAERLGLMAMRQRNLRDAKRYFTEALTIIKSSDPSTHALTHLRTSSFWRLKFVNYLAGVELRAGNIADAIDKFQRSKNIANQKLSEAEKAQLNNNELGEAVLLSDSAKNALPILKEELEEATKNNRYEQMTSRFYFMGSALQDDSIKDYITALTCYQDALKLARTYQMVELQVRILNGMGNLYLKTSNPKKALESYSEGLRLAQQVEGDITGVEIMIGMGLASQSLKRPDDIIGYFEAALDFLTSPKSTPAGLTRKYTPAIYVSLGDAYYQKHDFEKAVFYLNQALALDKEQSLSMDIRYSLYVTFAEIFIKKGDIESAKNYIPLLKAIVESLPSVKEHFKGVLKYIETN